ncbi:unnamed protein product, partial [Brassica rapa subsp. narinosa]
MHLTFLGFKSALPFVYSFLVLSLLCFGSRYLLSAAAGLCSLGDRLCFPLTARGQVAPSQCR